MSADGRGDGASRLDSPFDYYAAQSLYWSTVAGEASRLADDRCGSPAVASRIRASA